MNFGSLFSGIGGIDLGLVRAGMTPIWQCEIDPFCRAVLASNFPGVRCYDDVRTLDFKRITPPTCWPPDSPASQPATPDISTDSVMILGSGTTFGRLVAIYDHQSRFWRTSQGCLPFKTEQPLDVSFPVWPKSGSMRTGRCYQRYWSPVAPTTVEEYSCWLTPLTSDAKRAKFSIGQLMKHELKNLQHHHGRGGLFVQMAGEFSGYPTLNFVRWLMRFPKNWIR